MKHLSIKNTHGLTIVEVLVTVGLMALVATVAVPLISHTRSNVAATKLNNELKVLNLAIKSYRASGGEFNPDDSIDEILDKLKQQLSDIDAKNHAGFSGQHIDTRLTAVLIDKETPGPRLYWNEETQQFEKTTELVAGIEKFILTDYSGKSETNRKADSLYQYSDDEKGWVWNHGSDGEKNHFVPSSVATDPDADSGEGTQILISLAPSDDEPEDSIILPPPPPTQLAAPNLAVDPGTYSITRYDLPVVVINTNPASVSKLLYSLNYGSWTEYTGPVTVPADSSLRAQAVATSPLFTDSNSTGGNYYASPETLLSPSIFYTGLLKPNSSKKVDVVIENPNSPEVSRIDYRINGGAWNTYLDIFAISGAQYPEGAQIEAKAVGTQEYYEDSSPAFTFVGTEGSDSGNVVEFEMTATLDFKANNGHGNNVDGVDSSNPGKSKEGEDSDPTEDDEIKGSSDPGLKFTFSITNTSDVPLIADLNDTLPFGLKWDQVYNPDQIDVSFHDNGAGLEISALELPPGRTIFTLRTLSTSLEGTVYNGATVTPNAASPEFEPVSDLVTFKLEGYDDPQYININFTKLSTSAGFLNEGYISVNGVEHQFLTSDDSYGGYMDISVLVDSAATNSIELYVYTTPRPDTNKVLNYYSAIDGLIEIPVGTSFEGEANSAAKAQHWLEGDDRKFEFAFEDLAAVDPYGWGSDYDYNDYNFEITMPSWVSFNFGGNYFGL